MNFFAVLFLLFNSIALWTLPRRWAPLPLLIGVCYMTMEAGIEVGPFTFTIMRMLIVVGFLRTLSRGERPTKGIQSIDKLVFLWSLWCVASGFFHENPSDAIVFRLGRSFNVLGVYLLIRIFCSDSEAVLLLCKIVAILLVPIALEMVSEHITHRNLFSVLGGVSEVPTIRSGRLRAQGPFRHAILSGTVGAVCLPFMFAIWSSRRKMATFGLFATVTMVFASVSSGPILSLAAACGASWLWTQKWMVKWLRYGAIALYLAAEVVMTRPAYYLISKIDLTGSSTAYFRSRLIQSSIEHIDEWWFSGTDYTRSWMPSGVSWSPNHTDITNQYLAYGVWGGLPLMGLFIAILATAFIYVRRVVRTQHTSKTYRFLIWMLGASLFAHTVTFVSVAYFDQSYVFIYLDLAAIASLYAVARDATTSETVSQHA